MSVLQSASSIRRMLWHILTALGVCVCVCVCCVGDDQRNFFLPLRCDSAAQKIFAEAPSG